MKKVVWIGIVAILILSLGIWAMAAEKKGAGKESNFSTEKTPKVTPEAKAVADLAMAAQLADYGRKNKNPMALLVAAQIMKQTPTKEEQRPKKTVGEKPATTPTAKKGSLDSPEKLLADAKQMAKDNEPLVALIDKESKLMAQRGRVGGAIKGVDTIYRGQKNIYTIAFRGGELAKVAVVGDGASPLSLRVYDDNGHYITGYNAGIPLAMAEWVPRWDGKFEVEVTNLGETMTDIALATN